MNPFRKFIQPKRQDPRPYSVGLHPSASFNGTWRPYQERVLRELSFHLEDDFLHIVAAPGAGKTVLGLEVVQRLGRPALVLTPRTSIRDQWIETFKNMFFQDPGAAAFLTSSDIDAFELLTVSTYQALASSLAGRKKSTRVHLRALKDMAERFNTHNIGTLVLDESHHLTETWGNFVRALCQEVPDLTVVSLTATPPYDYDKKRWQQFVEVCGPIDAEIVVPELVALGNLCPHQDHILLNTPTETERGRIAEFRASVQEVFEFFVTHPHLPKLLCRRLEIASCDPATEAQANPSMIPVILALGHFLNIEADKRLLKFLAIKRRNILTFDVQCFQDFLRVAFSKEDMFFEGAEEFASNLRSRLTDIDDMQDGTIELIDAEVVSDNLIWSANKLESIAAIVETEAVELGDALRLVILTDWIVDEDVDVPVVPAAWGKLGVYPIFHSVRVVAETRRLRLCILSGRLVVLPKSVLEVVSEEKEFSGQFTHKPLASCEDQYAVIRPKNDATKNALVSRITKLFDDGHINIMVGTAGLLGEGWNSPGVNTLVLASYVGSFMLSNQMRGRALRALSEVPDKTANIWHLASVDIGTYDAGMDVQTLRRRFDAFIGVHTEKDVIESGISRLSVPLKSISEESLRAINARTIALAKDRSGTRESWSKALKLAKHQENADKVILKSGSRIVQTLAGHFVSRSLVGYFVIGAKKLWRIVRYDASTAFLLSVFDTTRDALTEVGKIEGDPSALGATGISGEKGSLSLVGGWRSDRVLLTEALCEVFQLDEGCRYLIVAKFGPFIRHYFAVPSALASNKSSASIFFDCWCRTVGQGTLVYTGNAEGQKLLAKALAGSSTHLSQSIERKQVWV